MDKLDPLETLLTMLPYRANNNILTPVRIAKEMVESLPDDVWNSQTKFLDIACKSGIFLYEIQKKLMNAPAVIKDFQDAKARKQHILQNQLYGIAMDGFTQLISIRTVYGHLTPDNNIISIENYTRKVKTLTTKEFKKTLDKEFGQEMKFDVVIGNPPYNDTDTKVATAVYSRFVTLAKELSEQFVSFIIPARWYCGGRGLDTFRNTMLTCKHISKLVDFENEADVFENVSIAGGVCYFLYDKKYVGDCRVISKNKGEVVCDTVRDLGKHKVFIRSKKALDIITKTEDMNKQNLCLNCAVQAVDYFGVKDNYSVYSVRRSEDDVVIIDSTGELYAERGNLRDNLGLIDSYNVIVTHAVGGEGYVIPKTIRVLEKGEACSVTYLCIGSSQIRKHAENLMKHIKTRFARFLINQAISGINISAKSFMFVPVEDYTNKSDIDWSKSIPEIDQQLYKKYNLSDEEIAYIEKTIKPME